MKKLFFTIVATIYATSLFAQQASQWSLSSVKSDVKTLIIWFGGTRSAGLLDGKQPDG